jgi:hypothetical protein
MHKKNMPIVESNYEYMLATMDYTMHISKNKNLRLQNESQYAPGQPYTTKWEIDTTKATPFSF